MKLHQYLALHKKAFADGESALTRAYHAVGQTAQLSGVQKSYQPRDEDGQQLPGEGTRLQRRVPVIMRDAVPALIRQMDLQASVDAGNQISAADVMVDGVAILRNVPVETLLFLEKKLTVLGQFIDQLPVLDEAETWEEADDGLSYKTLPSKKVRTDKMPEALVKAAATDKHPAQVDVIYLDKVVGDWTTIKFSGAIKANQKRELAEKLDKLLAAVKVARGEANSTEVNDSKIGGAVFDFLGWGGPVN